MVDENLTSFESSNVLRMFPTFVWKVELGRETRQSINRQIDSALSELRQSEPVLEPGQAWQSDQALHGRDDFRELVANVNQAAEAALAYLRIGHDGFEITACWANVSAPGAGHRVHSHPNNYLSGVYYVRTPDGAKTINFHDPRVQTATIRPPVTELTAENTDQVVVKVTDGTLLLFPAWLQHSVDANRSDAERISVSFNIMFSSYTQTMSPPLWQAG